MRISTIDIFQRATDNLNEQQALLIEMQSKIASGKMNLSASEDPIAALKSLNYRYELNEIQQLLNNTQTATSYLEYQESIFDTATHIYQRIQELTIYAGNASLSSVDRNSIAIEMSQLLEELVGMANSKGPNGDYLFSGFKTRNQPVVKDINGQYLFQGDEGQRAIMIGETVMVNVSDSGKEIFFNIPSPRLKGDSTQGVSVMTSAASALVNSGILNPLEVNDLKINNIGIPFSTSDGVSTTDSASSAIAISQAINSQSSEHGVFASVNSTIVDLGIYSANALTANQFAINQIQIIDSTGSESSLLDSINAQASLTGVVASQPGGVGTHIILTATDGRNIQLQTNGSASASFGNFNLTGGALDKVLKSTVSLRSHQDIVIGGDHTDHAGLSVGSQAKSLNLGTGVISTPVIFDNISDPLQSYSIIFNTPALTFKIVADENPNQALVGFENVTYVPGQIIEFNGIRVNITLAPQSGDVFGVSLQAQSSQDVFTTIQNIITSIQNLSDSPTQLNYEIGLGLSSLAAAQDSLIFARAKIGARLNAVDNQKNYQELLMFIAQKKFSSVTDLDYNEAISKLSQYSLVLQAAQQSFVRIQSLSLFNYIR